MACDWSPVEVVNPWCRLADYSITEILEHNSEEWTGRPVPEQEPHTGLTLPHTGVNTPFPV